MTRSSSGRGSARASRAGFDASFKRTLSGRVAEEKSSRSRGRHRQHARRVHSPEPNGAIYLIAFDLMIQATSRESKKGPRDSSTHSPETLELGKTWPERTILIALRARSWQNLPDMIPQTPAASTVLYEQFVALNREISHISR